MKLRQFVKPAGALATLGLIGLAVMSINSPSLRADSDSTVQIGFAIAPVQLNMKGLNPALVGKAATSSTRRETVTVATTVPAWAANGWRAKIRTSGSRRW